MQTLEELIALADQYRNKLSEITSYDDRIAELTARKDAQYDRVKKQAAVLTKARAAAAREVENSWLAGLSRWGAQRPLSGGNGLEERTGRTG